MDGTLLEMQDFSCTLYDTLDVLGYSEDIISIRRNFWREKEKIENAEDSYAAGYNSFVVGSKSEGITSYFQSDVDVMVIFNDVICTSDTVAIPNSSNMTVLHADTRHAPPGYTRLKVIRNNGTASEFLRECAFESESKELYLSSVLLANTMKCHLINSGDSDIMRDLAGPAVHSAGNVPQDFVLAFRCYCPQFLHTWASRHRYHNWPPADVIQEATCMFAQVVPVGSKGSDDQWREWRFCFIESELKLTHSLNEIQLKLYILLKMVAKEILCEISGEISSYIMKNVTYWLSELLPGYVFRRENIYALLIQALKLLQSCIRGNLLPYFMIPERNLLSERLAAHERLQLYGTIEEMIQEGPRFLLKCQKLRAAMTMEPAFFVRVRKVRSMIECLWYLFKLLEWYQADQFDLDVVYYRLADNVLPEWIMIYSRGFPGARIASVVNERVKKILS